MGPPPALSFPPPNREPSPAPGNPISTPGHYGGPAWRVSKWSAPPAQTAGVFFASRIAPSARGPQSRRGAPMPDGIRWVGLDAHARESTFAIFDQGTGELTTRRVVGRPHELLAWLRAVARPARMVYEAGPTGYGLARRARGGGVERGGGAAGVEGVWGGSDRLRARASCAGGGDRARGVRAEQDRAPAGGSGQDR